MMGYIGNPYFTRRFACGKLDNDKFWGFPKEKEKMI